MGIINIRINYLGIIYLKSERQIEGKVIERNPERVKIEVARIKTPQWKK